MPAFNRAKRDLRPAVLLESRNPAVRVEREFRTAAPTRAFALTYPRARFPKNVDERQFRVPIAQSGEIQPEFRLVPNLFMDRVELLLRVEVRRLPCVRAV